MSWIDRNGNREADLLFDELLEETFSEIKVKRLSQRLLTKELRQESLLMEDARFKDFFQYMERRK